ncbi:MAG: ISAzo13 family transposase, partial [Candidatus Magnetobacterium sp. LHC-1]
MRDENIILCIQRKCQDIFPLLDEHTRRLWAAIEAREIGHGGQSIVSNATGLSRKTIYSALNELNTPIELSQKIKRTRKSGGGRKKVTENDTVLLSDLEALVEPVSRGDPENPLRWTCKSTRRLAEELQNQGHKIGYRKVADLLKKQGYSLQVPRKTKEGSSNPDRNAQFEYINEQIKTFQGNGHPVISVDAKKKEQVGDFYNKGQEWQPKGEPEQVRVYDFIDKELGKVNPYGVYDQFANEGLVSVGIDHDTAEFAVESIKRWWKKM